MNASSQTTNDPSADFLKNWSESFSRILQAACTFTPDTLPPEMARQIRSGIFEALAKSWEEFMRSPQFLEGMKQFMNNAVAFRQMTNDFLARARQETQDMSASDVDSILRAVRELEARLTRRVDELAVQVRQSQAQAAGRAPAASRNQPTRRKSSPAKRPRRTSK